MNKKASGRPADEDAPIDPITVAVEDAGPSVVVVHDGRSGPPAEPLIGSPVLTLSQASTACAVNRGLLRRALDAGRFPNAYKAGDGVWRIPVADLTSAGFDPRRWEAVALERRGEVRLEVQRLRAENRLLRDLLTATQTVARERQERIDDLQFALRMLPEAWARKLTGTDRSGSDTPSLATGDSVLAGNGGLDQPDEPPGSPEVPARLGTRLGSSLQALWESRGREPGLVDDADPGPGLEGAPEITSDGSAVVSTSRARRSRWRFWRHRERSVH